MRMKTGTWASICMAAGWLMAGRPTAEAAAEPAAVAPAQTVILNEGSNWRYFLAARRPVYRKGQEIIVMNNGTTSALPPANWYAPDFDDGSWVNRRGPFFPTGHGWAWVKEVDGKGYLGYEGTSESMALLCIRGKFAVIDPGSVGDMTLSLTYRGGVIVYLNGKEVARGNLPDPDKKGLEALAEDYPTEAYQTADGKPIGIGGEAQKNKDRLEERLRKLTDAKIPAASLRPGVNVLAVEVHRAPYNGTILKCLAAHGVQQFDWLPMGLVNLELRAAGTGAAPNVARPQGLQVWGQSPASGVDASHYGNPLEKSEAVKMFGTRNGVFAGEIVVGSSEAIRDLKVECSGLAGSSALPIEVRYGVADKGAFSGRYDVLRPVPPAEVAVDKNGGAVQPVLLTVRVPKDAKPGAYKGTVTVKAAGAAPAETPVEFTVADWVMPDSTNFLTQMGLYESPESVAMQYKVDFWSDAHWKLVDQVFACMGEVGSDDVFIPVRAKTHLGNSQGMVRWIKKEGAGVGAQVSGSKEAPDTRNLTPETYSLDFSLVEKYLDLAIKRLGKPANVCFLLWDIDNGFRYGATPVQPRRGPLFTVFDPKTGTLEEKEGPKYGTPELREFWKPVADGLRKAVKDRGLEGSMLLGIIGDNKPMNEVYADLDAVFPGVKWVWAAHQQSFGAKHVAYEAFVYHQYIPPEPSAKKRLYGWQAERRWSNNRREGLAANVAPFVYRMVLESRLLCGYMGISRLGADFWPVLGRLSSLGGGTLGRRYPDVDWSQLNFGVAAGSVLAAGEDGPLGTMRFEALRAGAQESEARIFIEKALVDPEKMAKLGDDLARRCQDELDERQRQMILFLSSRHFYTGMGWEAKSGELYRLAAEVSRKLNEG